MKHKSIYNKHLFHLIHHLFFFSFDTHFSNFFGNQTHDLGTSANSKTTQTDSFNSYQI